MKTQVNSVRDAIAKIIDSRPKISCKRCGISAAQNEERQRLIRELMGRKNKAKRMLAATNRGPRRRRSYREIIEFLLSLPEQIESKANFDGDGFWRDECGDETNPTYLSATHIILSRYFTVKIFGWEFCFDEKNLEWIWHGVVLPMGAEERIAAISELSDALSAYVYMDDLEYGPTISRKMVRDALIAYQGEHGDGYEDCFYMRNEDGPLFLRSWEYECGDEDEYFKDLTPLTMDEAVSQFIKSEYFVYEPYIDG